MLFTISITTKDQNRDKPLICSNCDYGTDFIDDLKKKGYDVKATDIKLDGCYVSQREHFYIEEELARKLLVFKNTNHIDIICEEGYLNSYITQKIVEQYAFDEKIEYGKFLCFKYKKNVKKTKRLVYVEIQNVFNKEKFIEWWGENGCPCVIGKVDDPFNEGNRNV